MKTVIVAVSLIAISTGIAIAGPIEDRQAVMKSFDPAEAVIRKMVAPGDIRCRNGSDPTPSLRGWRYQVSDPISRRLRYWCYPDRAPTIWTDTAGFQAAAAKLVSDAKAAQGAPDAASFATAWQTVESDCGGCHRTYRVRAQRPPAAPAAQ